MPVQLTLSDESTRHLNSQGIAELCAALERYRDDLLRETERLEAGTRSGSGNPEITSTMVRDADLLIRRGYMRPRKRPLLIVSQIVGPVAGFLTGLLADMSLLKTPELVVLFVVLLTLTITATVVSVLKD